LVVSYWFALWRSKKWRKIFWEWYIRGFLRNKSCSIFWGLQWDSFPSFLTFSSMLGFFIVIFSSYINRLLSTYIYGIMSSSSYINFLFFNIFLSFYSPFSIHCYFIPLYVMPHIMKHPLDIIWMGIWLFIVNAEYCVFLFLFFYCLLCCWKFHWFETFPSGPLQKVED